MYPLYFSGEVLEVKGACSKLFGNEFFVELADMVTCTFLTNIYIIQGEKITDLYLMWNQSEKTIFMLLIVL